MSVAKLISRPQRLRDRTIIVTGAARGIGQAIARRLSEEGAFVTIADVDFKAATEALQGLAGTGMAVAMDVTDEASVERGIAEVVAMRGGLDALVNNAGISGPQEPLGTTDTTGWRRTLEVNLTGPFLCSRAALPYLIASKGTVIHMASALAFMGLRGECAYGPTKAGIVQLTKGMALDYAGSIRVNCVCPGAVRTPMLEAYAAPGQDIEALMHELGGIHPLHRRLADPREIADAVVFLASDDASLITGAAVLVDAGLLAG
jgi:NAD(P)-dependent dehydrogenase (short-subunit alcohol dehydrogenase family)